MYAVYILECADGTLYTGITTDLKRRMHEHNNSTRGATYTRVRRPVMLKFYQRFRSRSKASKVEYCIKQCSRKQKLELIQTQQYDHSLR